MKPLSPATRRRLLTLASYLDRKAAAIRSYCKARTPRRKTTA